MPSTGAQTLADGLFNRFYMLGLAKRARAEGIPYLEAYRAQERVEPRPESEALLGKRFPVADVEGQLEEMEGGYNDGLLKPNSGLSLKLP